MTDLSGKVAIVTGAARGLGAAYCVDLARHGAKIVAADLRGCEDTVSEVEKAGGRAIGVAGDVSKWSSAEQMADRAIEAFGAIDILINNAALYAGLHLAPFTAIPEDEWDACMAVNVKGLWQCAKAVVPAMRKRGGGSIINVSSLAAVYGMPTFLHYATSKGAVIGFTRSLARELGRDNIRVNAIAPSMVHTPGTEEALQDKLEKFAENVRRNQTIQRSLYPKDLVGTVLYLASDMSSFVTGQTIMVDGGTVFQ